MGRLSASFWCSEIVRNFFRVVGINVGIVEESGKKLYAQNAGHRGQCKLRYFALLHLIGQGGVPSTNGSSRSTPDSRAIFGGSLIGRSNMMQRTALQIRSSPGNQDTLKTPILGAKYRREDVCCCAREFHQISLYEAITDSTLPLLPPLQMA